MGNVRRLKGTGSISQRSDGRWVARVTIPTRRGEPRKRKVLYGKTREEAEAKLAALIGEQPERLPPNNRTSHLREARQKGSHTRREWLAKIASTPRINGYFVACYYCQEAVHVSLIEKDHFVPVSRGGSDALDNLVIACRPCNRGKADMTWEEWMAYRLLTSWSDIETILHSEFLDDGRERVTVSRGDETYSYVMGRR